ncbi:MAG TPA: ketol-acid reductoisomerase [Phycisphaerae bacterium]|nr:ketol-acid reductoisomerase [Phycisphaerae bacterium]
MPLPVYYEADADLSVLRSRTIAVLGYGSQGQAHAQNLRDAGLRVVVAQRPGGPNHALAIQHGFQPVAIPEATKFGDLLIFALPDEQMEEIFVGEVAPQLRAGQALGFIHGFAIRFGLITPPKDVDVIMIAPKGPGSLVREAFVRGGGLACILAVHQDATGSAKPLALAWGAGIGGGKGGMIETTFAAECESDLFGEQTVLCGGIIELMKAAYETLVAAGYPEEIAYLECIHEVKQIVDLQYAEGLAGMRRRISNTAAYGGLTRGPRLVGPQTRAELKAILGEVQSGRFATEWINECRSGKVRLTEMSRTESLHASETAGRRVREQVRNALPE